MAGGLAIATGQFHTEPYLTATPAGAIELAKLGLLDPIRQDVIAEKTKADYITKVVVIVQAGWFIAQCIARIIEGLPLTLLEIHVVSHVFIALLMYLCWFSKPYNALEPIVVTDQGAIETASLFTIQMSCQDNKKLKCVQTDTLDVAALAQLKVNHFDAPSSSTAALAEKAKQRFKKSGLQFNYYQDKKGAVKQQTTYLASMLPDVEGDPGGKIRRSARKGKQTISQFVLDLLPSEPWSWWVLVLFVSFGAFHLSAWNTHFPTTIECWMWRVAGLVIVALPLDGIVFVVLFLVCKVISNFLDSDDHPKRGAFLKSVFKLLNRLCGTLWLVSMFVVILAFLLIVPLSRLYFVAESFASLRQPPEGTYQTVQWTQFWPHA